MNSARLRLVDYLGHMIETIERCHEHVASP